MCVNAFSSFKCGGGRRRRVALGGLADSLLCYNVRIFAVGTRSIIACFCAVLTVKVRVMLGPPPVSGSEVDQLQFVSPEVDDQVFVLEEQIENYRIV